jgi:putative addiction module CopG family antidote
VLMRTRRATSTTTLNISLPEALKEHVQKRVAEGTFSNASDFVRALIRLDKEQQEKLAALRDAIAVGLDQLDRGEGSMASACSPSSWTSRSARGCPGSSSRPRLAKTFEELATTSPRTIPRRPSGS